MRFLRPIQAPLVDAIWAFAFKRWLQAIGHELAADAQDGAGIDVERPSNRGVRPTGAALAMIGFEQDAGAGQHPRGGDARAHQGAEPGALRFREDDAIGIRHGGTPG